MSTSLFRKYVLLIGGLVSAAVLASGGTAFFMFAHEQARQMLELQEEKAVGAAARIELFVKTIEYQLEASLSSPSSAEDLQQAQLEYLRLMRRVPAVTELTLLDQHGSERLAVSRLTLNRVNTRYPHTGRAYFEQATPARAYYGDVYFRKETEPYLTMSRRGQDASEGVLVAEVNLKFVWDVISNIKVGQKGYAYVVDRRGVLIAHPDIHRVLQKTSYSHLPHVQEALRGERRKGEVELVDNAREQRVLAAYAPVRDLGWTVFVELEQAEAFQPLRTFLERGLFVLLAALAFSVIAGTLLARRMVRPIKTLQAGVRAIGEGKLDQRIEVRTHDELEELAEQVNTMAAQLGELYSTLEVRVHDRTSDLSTKNQELNAALDSLASTQKKLMDTVEELTQQRRVAESANVAKSRFLAAASHDLRQPLHALNLYLGALGNLPLDHEAQRLLKNVRHCAQSLDDLFDGMLDVSRLDTREIGAQLVVFDVKPMMERLLVEFLPEAQEHGTRLSLRTCKAGCTVFSDTALLERIVRNLVSNAVRYTRNGRVLMTCRRVRDRVRISVIDTGIGIPADHHELIFEEFYQVGNRSRDRSQGLGLGLAIVRRLAAVLGTRVQVSSNEGHGSRFWLELPAAAARAAAPAAGTLQTVEDFSGLTVLVVDDEASILEAAQILLRQWGCRVFVAESGDEALGALLASTHAPDLLVCDYRLSDHEDGLQVIDRVREEFVATIPALLVTGDVAVPDSALSLPDVTRVKKPLSEQALRRAMSAALSTTRRAHERLRA